MLPLQLIIVALRRLTGEAVQYPDRRLNLMSQHGLWGRSLQKDFRPADAGRYNRAGIASNLDNRFVPDRVRTEKKVRCFGTVRVSQAALSRTSESDSQRQGVR
jgi:hypothetical protein